MKSFKIYDDRAKVVRHLASRLVLSTVVLLGPKGSLGERRQQSVFVAIASPDGGSDFHLYPLHRTGSGLKSKLGLPYSMWIVEQDPREFGELVAVFPPSQFVGSFGCLLPCMTQSPVATHAHICRERMTRIPNIYVGVSHNGFWHGHP